MHSRRRTPSSEMHNIRYTSLSDGEGDTAIPRSSASSPPPHTHGATPSAFGHGTTAAFSSGASSIILVVPPTEKRGWRVSLKELLNLHVPVPTEDRSIPFGYIPGEWKPSAYPGNAMNNRRYTVLTFLPLTLIHQFSNFFNLFYLLLALSQFIPVLKVGFLFTYLSPLALVVLLSILKESLDEWKRFQRDRRANGEVFEKVDRGGEIVQVYSANIKVGDILLLHHDQRVPADCVLLSASEKSGNTFLRTDQLDGETDWKLRYPLTTTKSASLSLLSRMRFNIRCEAPQKDIYRFSGALDGEDGNSEMISPDHMLWSSCIVASGTLVAAVLYTGSETRSALNSTPPRTKRGLIESELNRLAFLCFLLMVILSFLLVAQQHFHGDSGVMFLRFFILLSAMIPISMRVNVDVGRLWYSYEMGHDSKIPGTMARNTDLPEELGRLEYLFSDKTGTLTKNKMHFRVMQTGPDTVLSDRDVDRLKNAVREHFSDSDSTGNGNGGKGGISGRNWAREVRSVGTLVETMVLCHNVNPVVEETLEGNRDTGTLSTLSHQSGGQESGQLEYQASSPDEVALVKFCRSLGVVLTKRDARSITYTVDGVERVYSVVHTFPFSSERKCMGILLRDTTPKLTATDGSTKPPPIHFFMKGADTKMKTVIRQAEWLEECCQELSQMGLRTLVFAHRLLDEETLGFFLRQYEAAASVLGESRNVAIEEAMHIIEADLDLVGVTGVEDELQDDVVVCLETLGMCGIKVWMLTGDKVETAVTIGRSTRLIPRHGLIEYITGLEAGEVMSRLEQLRYTYAPAPSDNSPTTVWTLVVDGTSLAQCLLFPEFFVAAAKTAYSVIVARCSPTQKADVVKLMRDKCSGTRVAAVGDGGNDVSMIQAANVGIGVEGVEGKQASMAADFSITQFSHCLRLIMWHGRNSYRRTCRLSQFIMHRGIVYSVVQAAFSVLFAGTTMSLFNGYLLMGYSTVFTMAPVFALVLDEDFKESDVHEYPFLYKELVKSRSMNTRTFLQWVWLSFFQGGVMMLMSLELFSTEMFQIVTIAFTSLLITELIVIGSTAHLSILWRQRRSHFWLFFLSEIISLALFFLAAGLLPDTFDRAFFFSWSCWWRVAVICLASIGPLVVFQLIGHYCLFNKKFVLSFGRDL